MASSDAQPVLQGDVAALTVSCTRFCRLLRDSGLSVQSAAAAELMEATARVDVTDKAAFYYVARSVLTTDRRDWPVFDAAFHSFWRREDRVSFEVHRPAARGQNPLPPHLPGARGRGEPAEDRSFRQASGSFGARPQTAPQPTDTDETPLGAGWGEVRSPDLRRLSSAEVTAALQLVDPARRLVPLRPLRRPAPGPRDVWLDRRRMLRDAARQEGEVLDLAYRDRRRERRRIILLCDTSRSMRDFTRAVLGLPYALTAALDTVEAFFFSTRLTRVTHLLRRRSPEAVLATLGREVDDWGGGTRIGAALAEFNRHWAKQVLSARAVVVLVSDGLDAGDPDDLAREAQALRQRCWRLVWLNPFAGGRGFEPRAGGIRALLTAVDVMLPCRDLAGLVDFLQVVGRFSGWRDLDPRKDGAPCTQRCVTS